MLHDGYKSLSSLSIPDIVCVCVCWALALAFMQLQLQSISTSTRTRPYTHANLHRTAINLHAKLQRDKKMRVLWGRMANGQSLNP